MARLCASPATEIGDLVNNTFCIGQIQKLLFQKRFSSGTTENKFTISSTDPAVLATWTTVLTASDATKVAVSPFVQEPTLEGGAMIEFGGGNASLDGIPEYNGSEPSKFAAKLMSARGDLIEALKLYSNETDLCVYMVDQWGKIIGITDDIGTPTTFAGIPIAAFGVGDKTLGMFEGKDSNELGFYLPPNWSDKLHIITPTDFNAKTGLAN